MRRNFDNPTKKSSSKVQKTLALSPGKLGSLGTWKSVLISLPKSFRQMSQFSTQSRETLLKSSFFETLWFSAKSCSGHLVGSFDDFVPKFITYVLEIHCRDSEKTMNFSFFLIFPEETLLEMFLWTHKKRNFNHSAEKFSAKYPKNFLLKSEETNDYKFFHIKHLSVTNSSGKLKCSCDHPAKCFQ